MGENIKMVSDGVKVSRDAETGERLRISFTGGEDVIHIHVDVQFAPLLIEQIEKAGVRSRTQPIEQGELGLGSIFHTVGQSVRKLPDGGARLTIHISVDDGVRSLPLDLSPKDVALLIADLSGS